MNNLSFSLIAAVFILFALSRVVLQYSKGSLSFLSLVFWVIIWAGAGTVIIYPRATGDLASTLGVGRGSDVILYTSVIVMFYLLFRIYVYLSEINHNLTRVVRQIAIDEVVKEKK